ncbi:hypothetical protein ACQBAU_04460 [Propionibacteriaceae bacterium Y2011]
MDLDTAAGLLYAAPLPAFMAVRADLVKQAREDGDKAVATKIGKLAKPTRSAWLVNLLSHRDRELIDDLRDLATELAEAHRLPARDELRALTTRRNELITRGVDAATRLAGTADPDLSVTEANRRDVRDTLTAALADPAVAAALASGTLTKPVQWSGFGPVSAPAAAVPTRVPDRPADGDVAPVIHLDGRRRAQALRRAEAERSEAEHEQRRASAAVDRARRRIEQADGELTVGKAASAEARTAQHTAEAEVERVEQLLRRARTEYDRVTAAVDHAAKEEERARARAAQAATDLTAAEEAAAAAEQRLTELADTIERLGDQG